MSEFFAGPLWTGTLWPLIVMLAQSVLLLVLLLIAIAYILLADRKIWAAVQIRRGPNVVGPFGLLQSFADLLKFVLKEPIIPAGANKGVFLLAPLVTSLRANGACGPVAGHGRRRLSALPSAFRGAARSGGRVGPAAVRGLPQQRSVPAEGLSAAAGRAAGGAGLRRQLRGLVLLRDLLDVRHLVRHGGGRRAAVCDLRRSAPMLPVWGDLSRRGRHGAARAVQSRRA